MNNKVRGVGRKALNVNTSLASPFPPNFNVEFSHNKTNGFKTELKKINKNKKIKYQALPFPELRRTQTSINDWKRQKNKSGFTKYQLTC